MVESIEELKEICKKRESLEWGFLIKKLYRPLAWYIVRVLLLTPISANQVTYLSIIIGVIGGLLFLVDNIWFPLIGSIFLFLWYLGECCDGPVARYYNFKKGKFPTGYTFGKCIDWANIRIVGITFFTAMTIRMYKYTDSIILLYISFVIILMWFIICTLPGIVKAMGILKSSFIKQIIKFISYFDKRNEHGELFTVFNQIKDWKDKIHLYLYYLGRMEMLPFLFGIASILDIIMHFLNKNLIISGIKLKWIFIMFIFIGIVYLPLLFFELLNHHKN